MQTFGSCVTSAIVRSVCKGRGEVRVLRRPGGFANTSDVPPRSYASSALFPQKGTRWAAAYFHFRFPACVDVYCGMVSWEENVEKIRTYFRTLAAIFELASDKGLLGTLDEGDDCVSRAMLSFDLERSCLGSGPGRLSRI